MQITKNLIKFSNMIIRIPDDCKRMWDCSENRWGYIGRLTMTKLCARGKMLRNVNLKFILVRMQMRMLLKSVQEKLKTLVVSSEKILKVLKRKCQWVKRVGKPQGKVAKGCGAIMADRKKN